MELPQKCITFHIHVVMDNFVNCLLKTHIYSRMLYIVEGHFIPLVLIRGSRKRSVSHPSVTIWWPIYISRGFFGTAIKCEIARRFPRSVVKVGLNIQCKNISISSGVQPLTSTDLKLSYFNTLICELFRS